VVILSQARWAAVGHGRSLARLPRALRFAQRIWFPRSRPRRATSLEMAKGKYPPGITTPYPYPRQKNNPTGSPIYTGGYGFTPIPIPTWVWVTHRVTRTHKNLTYIKILYYTNMKYIHLNIITKILASFNHPFNTRWVNYMFHYMIIKLSLSLL
jgi:hypothetical protein